jgi:hypothetical protein
MPCSDRVWDYFSLIFSGSQQLFAWETDQPKLETTGHFQTLQRFRMTVRIAQFI